MTAKKRRMATKNWKSAKHKMKAHHKCFLANTDGYGVSERRQTETTDNEMRKSKRETEKYHHHVITVNNESYQPRKGIRPAKRIRLSMEMLFSSETHWPVLLWSFPVKYSRILLNKTPHMSLDTGRKLLQTYLEKYAHKSTAMPWVTVQQHFSSVSGMVLRDVRKGSEDAVNDLLVVSLGLCKMKSELGTIFALQTTWMTRQPQYSWCTTWCATCRNRL